MARHRRNPEVSAALAETLGVGLTRGEDWRKRSACATPTVDPEIFWPIGTTGPAHDKAVREAQKVCGGCPVFTECLTWALDHPREAGEGIYAGTTATQRDRMRRRP